MYRYIVVNEHDGYVFGNGDAARPAVFVKREDAHREASEWATATGERFRVIRFSTKHESDYNALRRRFDLARPPVRA